MKSKCNVATLTANLIGHVLQLQVLELKYWVYKCWFDNHKNMFAILSLVFIIELKGKKGHCFDLIL